MSTGKVSRRAFLAGSMAMAGTAALSERTASASVESLPEVDKPGRTPNTLFAVNIEMWFDGPFEQRIVKAAQLGFPAVEFWPYKGRDIDVMAKLLKEHNMTATQFTAWPFGTELNNPYATADNFMAAIEESCHIAEKLPGCEMFCVVAGNDIEKISKKEMHNAVIAKIKKAVPILEKYRKMIILEPMNPYNHPNHCLYGSRDSIAICKAVGSPWVKLNWDLFHMQRSEGNLIDNLRKGKDYIGYLQLADSPDRNEPGTGEINYTHVFQAIKEIGYQIPIGLECSPKDGDVVRAARRIYAADTW
jgi:hydroxypyruvate isomerase